MMGCYMNQKYSITVDFKILIIKFILSIFGLLIGCIWGLGVENNKWSQLIYTDIKIEDIDLGGKTREEARGILQSQYIDSLSRKKLYVSIDDKIYSVDNSNLIDGYDIEKVIDEAFSFGKDLSIIKKHNLIKNGTGKNYRLSFTYDNESVEAFITNIEKEVNMNPVNAEIEIKPEGDIKIYAEKKGYKLEREKLDKYIEEKIKNGANKDIHISAPILKSEAMITQSALSAINTRIASFKTSFESSSLARANNIEVCVNSINGKILMPGEMFSFNDVVGERTKERGYQVAPVIINNRLEQGLGGGICQVSSTLYNAILQAGLQPIERKQHSLPASYVKPGLDATVDWGNIDFKFKNTLEYPVYIEGYTLNRILYINIFSNSSALKKEYLVKR